MSKEQLINSGKFRLNFSDDDETLKNILHNTLGEDFRKIIDDAYLFNDKLTIDKLTILAKENIQYAI